MSKPIEPVIGSGLHVKQLLKGRGDKESRMPASAPHSIQPTLQDTGSMLLGMLDHPARGRCPCLFELLGSCMLTFVNKR